jgi:hypothetical protein
VADNLARGDDPDRGFAETDQRGEQAVAAKADEDADRAQRNIDDAREEDREREYGRIRVDQCGDGGY